MVPFTTLCLLLLFATYYASGLKPTETTLTLTKDSADPDSLGIGMKSTLTLIAAFSEPTTGGVIELLPSVNETVLAIGKIVSVTKGNELVISEANWDTVSLHPGKEYSASDPIAHNTRGVFTLGNVTFSSGNSDAEEDYKITIVYEVVMTSMGNYADGASFMTSAGMEYGDYVWISQDSFTLTAAVATVSEEPAITSQDVSTITIGQPLTVDITMRIPYARSTLKIEALDMGDTKDVYVTRMRVKSVNEAFAYQINLNEFDMTQHACPLKTSMALQTAGPLINKESQTSAPDPVTYELVMEITFLSRATTSIVDNQYTIGIGVDINSENIWVTSFVLTAATTSLPVFSSVTVQAADVPAVSPGFVGEVTVDLDMPEQLEQQFNVSLNTLPLGGAKAALSLVSVRQTSYGSNLPCDVAEPLITFTASATDGPKDTGVYTFTLSNYGFNDNGTDADKNKLTLAVVFMVKVDPDVYTDDNHKLVITIPGTDVQEKTITIGNAIPFPDSVNYLFDLTTSCPTNIFESGSSIMFDVIVTTERNVTGGPMEIVAPIPSSSTASNLKFCGAKVKNIGKNVICAQEGDVQPTLTSWLGDGVLDHAVFSFDNICNKQNEANVSEDKFTIEIIVQVKDTMEILTNGINDTFGIGIKYSNTEIWVASYDFQINPPTVLDGIDFIQNLLIKTEDLVDACPAPSLALQWSPDGLAFHDLPLKYDVPVLDGSNTRFSLTTSLITKYVRLTDKTCTAGCRPTYSFETQPGTSVLKVPFGTASKRDLVKNYLMFARDQNDNTCFDLPIKSNTTTLPALLVVITDIRVAAPYSLALTGKGFSCNTTDDHQVTIPMYGTDTALTDGLGKLRKCKFTSMVGNSTLKTCNYQCDCTGDGCNTLALFMLHKDETPTGPYQLCELTIT